MELFGSRDGIVVGMDARTPSRSVEPGVPPPSGRPYRNLQERFRPAYAAEMPALLEVAAGKRQLPCTLDDALAALRIALACDISRAEHRPVELAELT